MDDTRLYNPSINREHVFFELQEKTFVHYVCEAKKKNPKIRRKKEFQTTEKKDQDLMTKATMYDITE